MIKKLRYLFTLMLLLVASVGWAEGDEVYKTALFGTNYNSQSVSSYTATWTATNGGFTVSLTNFNNNNNGWSFVKCGRKNNASVATITTSEPIDKAITKVVVTIDAITASNVNSIKLYTSSDNSTWTEAGSFSKATGAQTVSLASPTADLYYKIEFDCASGSSNGLVTVSKVEYYYNPSGTVAPSISADDVSIAYDATSGEIEYTINNGVDGGALSATTDAEWLTIETIGTTIPFTCEANDGAERTATVTLTYTYNTSEIVTKDVLVTQALNPNGPGSQANPYTVAQARAAIDAGTGLEGVYATGIVSQVDSYNSSYNSITYWISEDGTTATDQLEVYSGKGLNNANFTSIDDVVVGATVVVYGTLKKFNDTYEFDKNNYLVSYTAPTVAVESPTFSPVAGTYAEAQSVTISCGTNGAKIYYTVDGSDPTANSIEYTAAINVSTTTTIKAIAIAGDENSAIATATYHINSQASPYTVAQALAFNEYPANGIYVHGIVSTAPTMSPTNNGELTYYISDNGEATSQLEVYKGKGLNNAAFEAQDDLQVGDIVTVYGNVKIYQETKEFDTGNYLVSFERPTSTEPSITVAQTEVSVPADGGDGTIEVTYQNIEEYDAQMVDAEGNPAEYDWIEGGLNSVGNVEYIVEANTGEARTAYLQVYSVDPENVNPVTITFTQAGHVADYAILPFVWEGGASADLLDLAGVTAQGLGSDYAAGNAPYLVKFDGTGDYILVKTDSQPGIVTIGVKMIGGATTSKITVQGSSDGESFTDIQELTISGAQNDVLTLKTTNPFAAADRYVKLLFTKGSNIGVGPISIAKPSTDPIISAEDVNIEADATSGEIEYTITNPVAGTSLNATTDADWISKVAVDAENNKVTFNTTANTETTPRTGVITLTYGSLTKNVTITQAKATPVVGDDKFELVTDASTLAAGDEILIAHVDAEGLVAVAMGEQKTNNRAGVEVVYNEEDGTLTPNSETKIVTLEGATGAWYFKVDDGYLYAASSDKNYLKTQTEANDNSKAAISIDGNGNAAIIFQGTNTHNVLRYNGSNGSSLFSCYASGQQDVQIYRKVKNAEGTVKVTIAEAATDGTSFYGTMYYSDKNLVVPQNAVAETYKVEGGALTVSKTYAEGDVVPAGTGVVIKTAAHGNFDFAVTTAEGEVDANNMLLGTDTNVTTTAPEGSTGAYKFYMLSLNASGAENSVGFYFNKGCKNGEAFMNGAHKAYLAVPVTTQTQNIMGFPFGGDATGIEGLNVNDNVNANEVYDLQGRRMNVNNMPKGIYIVNGKKVVIK